MAKGTNPNKSNKKKEKVDEKTLQEMIERKAYQIYEERGKEEQMDLDHWLEAEKIVKANVEVKSKRKAKAKKKPE